MLDPTKPVDMPSIGSRPAGQIAYYGCTRCQCQHFEGTRLFQEHLHWQSRHGIQEMCRAAYLRQLAQTN